ncbi:MAG: hypothetical protein O3B64_02950 [bacterium]|nr:hypothetical protein [bacterium]
MKLTEDTILIIPQNDPESLQIGKIAHAAGIPTLYSEQPHGARLENEPDLFGRLQELDPNRLTLVILEIPGPKKETELRALGYRIDIIDHHMYDDLDRMQPLSSLEQFLAYFEIDQADLMSLGFNPRMVLGVGVIDRGFLWQLKREGFENEEAIRVRAYYRELLLELGAERRFSQEALAKEVWEKRRMEGDVLILESTEDHLSIRDPLSFLMADAYPDMPPETIIRQGNRRVYVQESKRAPKFLARYGGFTFGHGVCWGMVNESGHLPTTEELLEMLR